MRSNKVAKQVFTVLAGFLSIHCLQILTGDKEQNRSGTGGEPTKEALLERLALKSVGWNNTTALFPRVRQECWSDPSTISALYLISSHCPWCPLPFSISLLLRSPTSSFSIHRALGWHDLHSRGVTLSLILTQSLLCSADLYSQPPHHCSGYHVIHWNPYLAPNSVHLQLSSNKHYHSYPSCHLLLYRRRRPPRRREFQTSHPCPAQRYHWWPRRQAGRICSTLPAWILKTWCQTSIDTTTISS